MQGKGITLNGSKPIVVNCGQMTRSSSFWCCGQEEMENDTDGAKSDDSRIVG
jgi:hypothetical protein